MFCIAILGGSMSNDPDQQDKKNRIRIPGGNYVMMIDVQITQTLDLS